MDQKAWEDQQFAVLAEQALAQHKSKRMTAGAQASPLWEKLVAVMQFLRDHGVTFWAIVGQLPAIVAALQSGNLAAAWTIILALFHLPPTTAAPAL